MNFKLKKETIIAAIIGLFLGALIIILKEYREGIYSRFTSIIWLGIYVGVIIYVILNKEKRKVQAAFYSLVCSFIVPGLGQLIYGKQIVKFILLFVSATSLYIYLVYISEFIPQLLFLGMTGEYPEPSLNAFLFLGLITIGIYNLWDAYKVGLKYSRNK